MGAKKVLPVFQLFNAAAMTGTSTLTSAVTNIQNLDNIGLQIQWTGTPTGTITLNCSLDGNSFYALTLNPAIAQPAGQSGGGYLVSLNQLPFPLFSMQYVNSSGTGALSAWIFGKDLN